MQKIKSSAFFIKIVRRFSKKFTKIKSRGKTFSKIIDEKKRKCYHMK